MGPHGPREAFPYPGYMLPRGRSPSPSSLLIQSLLSICLSLSSSPSLRKTLRLAFQASHLVLSPPCLCRVCYRQWVLLYPQTLHLSFHLAQGTTGTASDSQLCHPQLWHEFPHVGSEVQPWARPEGFWGAEGRGKCQQLSFRGA